MRTYPTDLTQTEYALLEPHLRPEFQVRANPNTLQAVCYSLIFVHRLDEAQAIADQVEQQPLDTGWLNIRAFLQSSQGNLRAAVELNRQNLALCRSMGLTPSMVAILLNLSSDLDRLREGVEAHSLRLEIYPGSTRSASAFDGNGWPSMRPIASSCPL